MDLTQKSLKELAVLAKEMLGEGASPTTGKMREIAREVQRRSQETEFADLYLDLFNPTETLPPKG